MDRGAWRATVHGVAKSRTRLKWLSPHSLGGIVQIPGGSSLSCVDLGELKSALEDKEPQDALETLCLLRELVWKGRLLLQAPWWLLLKIVAWVALMETHKGHGQLEPELLGAALWGLGLGPWGAQLDPSKCLGRAALRTFSQRLPAFWWALPGLLALECLSIQPPLRQAGRGWASRPALLSPFISWLPWSHCASWCCWKPYSCREAGCLAGAGSLVPGILHGTSPGAGAAIPAWLPGARTGGRDSRAVTPGPGLGGPR